MQSVQPMPADPLAIEKLAWLHDRLISLRTSALDLEAYAEDEIALIHPERRVGARNLVDYLALRQSDIRDLQQHLRECGLSSLGVVQGNVMASINSVIRVLDRLCHSETGHADHPQHPTMVGNRSQLEEFTNETLGAPIAPGLIRIMVTVPSEASKDPTIIESLLEQGMTIMRVNCAHDGPQAWKAMVSHLNAAKAKLGKKCLAGAQP